MNTGQDKLRQLGRLDADDWDKITLRSAALMAGGKFGCSESLLLAFQEALGSDYLPEAAVAMSSSFRGGMGGAGCACGALSAGQMVLGSVFGYQGDAEGQQNPDQVKKARELYRELHDRFQEMNKSACCRLLLEGLTPHSRESREKCTGLVRSVAALAGGIIAREVATEESASNLK
jgi:C_GCAxxG_C_C family probable redox protein